MSSVAIFVEGGGSVRTEQRVLRVGFDIFFNQLKQLAAARGKRFRLVTCGSRDEAYGAFRNERKFEPETHSLLLVDSEEPLNEDIKAHLIARETHWDLADIGPDDIHGMVTTMETWIVADRNALKSFYGQRFAERKLPNRQNLEEVTKHDVCRCLNDATRETQPGTYHKMRHAPKLLERMDLNVVRNRCVHCDRLIRRLEELLTT